MSDEYPYKEWFTYDVREFLCSKVPALNDKMLKEHHELKNYYVYDDDSAQYLEIRYVGFISQDEIDYEVWNNGRFNRAMGWVNEQTSSRMFYHYDKNDKIVFTSGTSSMPMISRVYFYDEEPPKFTVTDGQHRIAASKEKGLKGILCNVSEEIKFRNDFSEDELKQYLEQQYG